MEKCIINPESGRPILVGGKLHRQLMKKGKLPMVEFPKKVKVPKLNLKGIRKDEVAFKREKAVEKAQKTKKNKAARPKRKATQAQLDALARARAAKKSGPFKMTNVQ